jgi:hypothetical protein
MIDNADIVPDTHSGIAPPHGNPAGAGTAEVADRRSAPANAQDAQVTTEGVGANQTDRSAEAHDDQPEFADVRSRSREKT